MKVTSILDSPYQRLESEDGISCRRQQVSHDGLCRGLNQSQHGYIAVVICDPCEWTS